jgi:aryl-alcohol dehydrogenase-like predicted oxidoreductase
MNHSDDFFATRRSAVKLGVYGSVALLGSRFGTALAADSKLPLITKAIPATGEKLPVIGVGTNSFNEAGLPNLQTVIKRMNELGGSVIDTAAGYGESEATLGKILDNLKLRDKFFLATKLTAGGGMGMGPPPGTAPAGAAGMGMMMGNVSGEKSFERSLERLKISKLDLLMVHNMSGVDELMPKLLDWKQAGKIRYLGVSTSNRAQHAQMVECIKKYPLDFVEVDYSIESREAEQTVLPAALARKVGVMINVPFGGRGGRTLLTADGRQLPTWAAEINCSNWSQFLLKFVISHPAVTVAIPGSTKLEHMEANQAAARGVLPDAAMRKRMQDFWDAA